MKNAEALALVKNAIETLEGSLEDKLAAIEKAVKNQTTDLSAKLALIQGTVEAGFADNKTAIGLVKNAIGALGGTVEEKLKAVENAVRNQGTSLADKLTLIDQTLNAKLTDIKSQQGLIKDAVNSLKGDYAAALAALKAAVNSMTSTLETKLGAIKTSVDEGVLDITEGQKLIQTAIENSTAEGTSASGGFNKDEILDLNLKKGCVILTTEFWNKYYNKTGSDEYKKISALLDATLPIPTDTKLEVKGLYYVGSGHDKLFFNNPMHGKYSNLKITPDNRYDPMLLVANVDKEWSGSVMRHTSATSGLMMLGRHFAFSYKNRSACAVYKVNYMAVISFSSDSLPLIYDISFPFGVPGTESIYPGGLPIKAYTVKTVSFGRQYCNRNDQIVEDLALAYRFDTSPAFAGIDNVTLTVDLRGNGVISEYYGFEGEVISFTKDFHSDLPLKHIFTYTDSRKDSISFTFFVDEIAS